MSAPTVTGLLTVDEAATAAGVTVRTVRRWVSSGLLHAYATQGRRSLYLARDVVDAARLSCR